MSQTNTSPPRLLRRFGRNECGAIAVMFALMLPVIIGFIGLGLEVGMWFKERRAIQTASDAAAISAAIENSLGATSAEVTAAALQEATRNGFDAASDTLTVNIGPATGPNAGDTAYVEVLIDRQLTTLLSQIFLPSAPVASTRAVASTSGDQEACVLALSTTAMNSVYLNGSGTNVVMDGCAVVANSNHSTKAINVQNGSLSAECLSTVGAIGGEANITTACSATVEGSTAADDPMADLDVPAEASLTVQEDPPGNQSYTPSDSPPNLSPGIYVGGLDISAGSTVVMDPGVYVMDGGDFQVNGGATITGTDVVIILTDYSGGSAGSININGGGSVELQAPTSGTYTGVLFYQDRNGGSSASQNTIVNGGAEVELTGMVYTPNTEISFSGGATMDNNGCLMLVAQTVSFNGSADLNNQCDMFGGNPVLYGASPGLVE
ncbi:pilus assembly protein TadG-related protein [Pseudomonadota bacterium]